MCAVARELKRPGVESTVDFGHLLKGHDGRLCPHKAHQLFPQVLAPCAVHGDSYRRQEARVGHYNTMHSQEYLGAFLPLKLKTTHVDNSRDGSIVPLCCKSPLCKRGHRLLHVANAMLEMG